MGKHLFVLVDIVILHSFNALVVCNRKGICPLKISHQQPPKVVFMTYGAPGLTRSNLLKNRLVKQKPTIVVAVVDIVILHLLNVCLLFVVVIVVKSISAVSHLAV